MKSKPFNWLLETKHLERLSKRDLCVWRCLLCLAVFLWGIGLALPSAYAQEENIYLDKTAKAKPTVKNPIFQPNSERLPITIGICLSNGAQRSTWSLDLPRNVANPNLLSKYSYMFQAALLVEYKKIGLQIGFGGENTWIQSKETNPRAQGLGDSSVTIDFRASYRALPILLHYIPYRSKSEILSFWVMGGPSILFFQDATADITANVGNVFYTGNANVSRAFSRESVQLVYGAGMQLALTPLVSLDLNIRNSVGLVRNNSGIYTYQSPGASTSTPVDIYLQNIQLLAGIMIRLTPPPVPKTTAQ